MYLGIWTTSQTVGGMTGNFCGGYLLNNCGWQAVLQRPIFVVPCIVLCLALGWFVLEVPKEPSDVPLACEEGDHEDVEKRRRGSCCTVSAGRLFGGFGAQVYVAALAAFFVKFVRYALLFWLPYYNWAVLGFDASKAAYHASMFEFGGFFGSMALGPLSDRLEGPGAHRRAAPSAVLMFAGAALLGIVCPQLQAASDWPAASREFAMGLGIFLVGIAVDGPESIITGALCNDLCEDSGLTGSVGRVVGLVNGTGILGALLAGPAVTYWAHSCGGWPAVFPFLAIISLLGVAALLPLCKFVSWHSVMAARTSILAASCAGAALVVVLLFSAACNRAAAVVEQTPAGVS